MPSRPFARWGDVSLEALSWYALVEQGTITAKPLSPTAWHLLHCYANLVNTSLPVLSAFRR